MHGVCMGMVKDHICYRYDFIYYVAHTISTLKNGLTKERKKKVSRRARLYGYVPHRPAISMYVLYPQYMYMYHESD